MKMLMLALLLQAPAVPTSNEPVAIVAAVTGPVTLGPAGAPPTALPLFERLPSGAVMRTGPGARATIAFATGERFELQPDSTARIEGKRLVASTGSVTPLASVSALPRMAAAASDESTRPAAVRLRGQRFRHLYPEEATTVASRTVLRFTPPEGATAGSPFTVIVEDEVTGTVVHRAQGPETAVSVPVEALKPGSAYFWTVRAQTAGGVVRATSRFETLSAEQAAARDALQERVAAMKEASGYALLAELDRGLGLMIEARDAYRRARALSSEDPALLAAQDRFEAPIEGVTGP